MRVLLCARGEGDCAIVGRSADAVEFLIGLFPLFQSDCHDFLSRDRDATGNRTLGLLLHDDETLIVR